MNPKTHVIDSQKKLRMALMRPIPSEAYEVSGIELDFSVWPSAADLVSSYSECTLISNGSTMLKCSKIEYCRIIGSFSFMGCELENCYITHRGKGLEYLSIIGGSLKKTKIDDVWQSVNFGPNYTENVQFLEHFLALELILRINCAVTGGIVLDKLSVAKVLAGILYDKSVEIPSQELVEGVQNIIKEHIRRVE